MSLDEKEFINKALDRAEEKISEEPVEPKEDLAVEAKEAEVAEQPQTTKQRERDISGKFAKSSPETQVNDQAVEEQSQEVEPTEQVSDVSPIEAPIFWSAELKAAVAEAKSEDAKKIINLFKDHDVQREQWARRNTAESERGRELEKKLSEIYEPYRPHLQRNGVRSIEDATSRLLAWNEIFESDPKTAIADLMRKNNLSPNDFLDGVEGEQNFYPQDPRVEEALNEAREAKRLADEQRAFIERQKNEAINYELEAFKQGTDSLGNKRASFVEMYQPQIAETLLMIQKDYPQVPRAEALNAAYEIVLKHARESLGVQATPQKPIQKVVAEAKKAQAAASSVTGAPRSGTNETRPRLKGNNFKEKLNSAMDNASDRLGA